MKLKQLLLIVLLFSAKSFSQSPGVDWGALYGGPGNDSGESIVETLDQDGFIVAGYQNPAGSSDGDVLLMKTDLQGVELWSHTYGGNEDDTGRDVVLTAEGDIVIGGDSESFSGSLDVYLIKTDPDGNEIWSYTYGGSGSDFVYGMNKCDDGGFVVTGFSNSYSGSYDMFLMKIDSNGTLEWETSFDGYGSLDLGNHVIQTNDGGYMLTGYYLDGTGYPQLVIVKTDSNGNKEWDQEWGEQGIIDSGRCVQQTSDGGYIVTGLTTSYGAGMMDAYIIKTDANGNEEWTTTYGTTGTEYSEFIEQTSNDNYIITGFTTLVPTGNTNIFLLKLDTDGNFLWDIVYDELGGEGEGKCLKEVSDGSYIVSGFSKETSSHPSDVVVFRTLIDNINTEDIAINNNKLQVYPNPSSELFTITPNFELSNNGVVIDVINLSGEIVYKTTLIQKNNQPITVDLSSLNSGIYLLRYFDNGTYHHHKIVKQ